MQITRLCERRCELAYDASAASERTNIEFGCINLHETNTAI